MVYCTIKETSTLLGYKSGATLYRLVREGHLDDYLWNVEGKIYLYMGKRKGKRLAEKIKSLTSFLPQLTHLIGFRSVTYQ